MKLYDMIHAIVLAFKPDEHPWLALLALALLLAAFVVLPVTVGGNGAMTLLRAFL